MIYFISPKQPTNLQANLRIAQLVKRQASNRKDVGSIPAQTICFLGFFFLFPKKKYVRAFSQPEPTNQPVIIFSTGRSEKNKNQDSWILIEFRGVLRWFRIISNLEVFWGQKRAWTLDHFCIGICMKSQFYSYLYEITILLKAQR